ncbi:MAG: FtsX-like permease family protein [Parafilimonas sp.]
MVKAFFRIAVRNLSRNKVYAAINIISLSIGLAGCLIVANVVIDDLSYDKQWKNAANIYRVTGTSKITGQKIPAVLGGTGPEMEKSFPEIEATCRITKGNKYFSKNSRDKMEVSCIFAEASIFKIFDFKFIENSTLTGKSGYNSVIITKKIKDTYFADTDPVGKPITGLMATGETDSVIYIVTGIIESIPYNSHLRAEAVVIKQFAAKDNQLSTLGVGYIYPLYVLLKPATNTTNFKKKVNSWHKTKIKEREPDKLEFQPLKEVYLHSDFAKGYQPVIGSMRNVYIFSGIAIVLLLIACFNFINLTTASALKRMTETGVRKVLGANRFQLIMQFLFESLLFFIISFILAILFYRLSIKGVETYIGHKLIISFVENITLLGAAFFVLLVVCICTGLYPAMALARTKMAVVLKGKTVVKTGNEWLRKALVVGQFSIAIIIIIAAIVVRQQLFFLNHTELGYDKQNLLNIEYTNWGTSGAAFRAEVKKIAGVENASISRWRPGGGGGSMTMKADDPETKGKQLDVWFIEGDIDLVPTLKLHLEKGRLLNNSFAADAPNKTALYQKALFDSLSEVEDHQSLIISHYAAQVFDSVKFGQPLPNFSGVPVGIVSDFHNESLRTVMKPCVIRGNNNIDYGNMLIRIYPGTEKQVIAAINKLWKQYYQSQILNWEWVAASLENQYKAEQKMQQLFFFFSYLCVFLACMGLFGLVSFATEIRTREIGIRKVLGATATIITIMISKDFLKLVVAAILFAAPVAWWLMHQWLQDYAYRISISWWFIVTAGLITVVIAFITISFHTIKAALANPVKSLRTE